MKNFIKKRSVLAYYLLFLTVFTAQHVIAGVYFIDKPDNPGGTQLGRCIDRGYTKTEECEAPFVKGEACSQNTRYHKGCICPADYNSTEKDCKDKGSLPMGDACNGKYKGCGCSADYKFTEKQCKDQGKVPFGDKCSQNGVDKYKSCACDAKYKKTCKGDLQTVSGPSCDGKYEKCHCSGNLCSDNGPAIGAKKCISDVDGKTYWSSCKQPADTCEDHNMVNIDTYWTNGDLAYFVNTPAHTKVGSLRCIKIPTCESLGFTSNINCKDNQTKVKCPFDITKEYCYDRI